MAKRRNKGEADIPFIALMDTMTNVVGVLTIVLVMIGISLARAVNNVISSLPSATEEQVREAQARLDMLRAFTPDANKLKSLEKPDLNPARIKNLDDELAKLEKSARDKGVKLVDLDALRKELAKREADLKQKKITMDQLIAEQEKLKGLIDKTPVYKPVAPKNVHIPASRPIPKDARVRPIMVVKNGVYLVDVEGAKEAFIREIKAIGFSYKVEASRVKRGNTTKVIYDHVKLAKYFENRKIKFHEFQITMVYVDWTSSPILRLTLPPSSPQSPAQLTQVNIDNYRNALRTLKSTPSSVVMFRVMGDAFENYLAAREICDSVGVPAGWEFAGNNTYDIHLYEIETNKPKPPPAPVVPKPAGQIEIKSPTQKLD